VNIKTPVPEPRAEANQTVQVEIGTTHGPQSMRISFTDQGLTAHGDGGVVAVFASEWVSHAAGAGPAACTDEQSRLRSSRCGAGLLGGPSTVERPPVKRHTWPQKVGKHRWLDPRRLQRLLPPAFTRCGALRGEKLACRRGASMCQRTSLRCASRQMKTTSRGKVAREVTVDPSEFWFQVQQ
jgi:hypothetical protein